MYLRNCAAGAEIDLALDLPGNRRWAIEITRGLVASVSKGFYNAIEDLAPERAFIVHSGDERYRKAEKIEAIGLMDLAEEIARL